ncbi:peptidase S41 [Bacteroidales bacterium OttesenSCG-928-A17]|nr:peptidase S41 [Bacteroidales bacterium OttesenSCG-928-A17]
MKKSTTFIFAFLSFCLLSACSQSNSDSKFNLDFEQVENGQPVGWHAPNNAQYAIYIDSIDAKSGKNAIVIEYKEEGGAGFSSISYLLPENYDGKKITLSGYIKTENVTDGYAGLWMRIDPRIAFDNMNNRGITGNTDWQKYEVTLAMNPSDTKQIVIGGLLTGKGKGWFDHFEVHIDGKKIDDVTVFVKELSPADEDKEFDKGSNISFPDLTDEQIRNLDLLGRLWGFLKYHHSEVAKGNYNWDYELFRILPEYLEAKDNKQRDQILLRWINKYGGAFPKPNVIPVAADAYLKPDLSWIEKSGFSTELKNKIDDVYTNRNQGSHHYIEMAPGVNNPIFKNEREYSNMPYPDAGFRLLSLYRFWNIIHYYFPNKYLTNKDWNDVLKEYIPVFIAAKDELEYELAAIRLIGEINDTHANLWGGGNKLDEHKGRLYAPFRVQFIENKLIITDFYDSDTPLVKGLAVGDIITHINNEPVNSIVEKLRPYYPHSNEAAMFRDMSGNLLRSNQSTISINYINSSGTKKQKVLQLYSTREFKMLSRNKINQDGKTFKFLDDNIGYITLATIKNEDIPEIKKQFIHARGIIMDIRNYPSTFVPFSLGSYFISGEAPFVKFTNGSIKNPGEFTFTPPLTITNDQDVFRGKLVVLVNESTQSQAEYTAMAFRAGINTTIIGSTTAGADGNVSQFSLPGGLSTMISGIGVYYPDGTQTQRVGIIPDIVVKPTIKGIKSGKDEVLEKAIEFIKQ